MHEQTIEQLTALMSSKICKVCVDRNVDETCNYRDQGTCSLMAKLPLAAEAILKVSSDRIEPYIESIRQHVCAACDLRYEDGSCDSRDTDRCMLNSYLPLFVETIEDYFKRS
jgi:hypothetical protein